MFKNHYEEYCRQIGELDLASMQDALGIAVSGSNALVPFFGETYLVSGTGITDELGKQAEYGVCVILAKYLLLCPKAPVVNREWASLKDFHKRSQLTNFNVFLSDAELPIIKTFSGRIAALTDASLKLGGKPVDFSSSHDLSMEFIALPKIKILLAFNDGDDEFPASCSLLFERHAEEYLDPESLIMVGIAFTHRLKKLFEIATE